MDLNHHLDVDSKWVLGPLGHVGATIPNPLAQHPTNQSPTSSSLDSTSSVVLGPGGHILIQQSAHRITPVVPSIATSSEVSLSSSSVVCLDSQSLQGGLTADEAAASCTVATASSNSEDAMSTSGALSKGTKRCKNGGIGGVFVPYIVSPDDPLLKKGNSILDGKYFVVIEKNDRRIKCACQSCPNKKVLSARTDALSNLVTHMRRLHPNKLDEMEVYRNTKGRRRKRGVINGVASDLFCSTFLSPHKRLNKEGATSTTPGMPVEEELQRVSTTSSGHYKTASADPITNYYAAAANRVSQKEADAAVATYIVQGFHPLSTVEQPEFRNLISKLNPSVVVLSRRSVSRHIESGYKSMVSAIQDELGRQRYVCSTADVCHAGQGTFVAVTLHWIDPVDLERRSAVVACRRVTAKEQRNTADILVEVFNEYGVGDRKLVARLTDNITNCADAFKEFNIIIGTGNKNFRGDDDDDEECDEYEGVGHTIREIGAIGAGASGTGGMGVSQTNPTDLHVVFPNHVSCTAHLLDQVITVDARHALQTKAFANMNSAIFGKCSSLWKIANKPKSFRVIRDKLGFPLKNPCPSKWTSVYDCVISLLKVKDVINEVMQELHLPEFQDVDFDFLHEYCEIVKPIAVAVKRLQEEKQWYYGELIPTLLVTDNKIDILQHNMFRYCFPLYHAISYGFRTRFVAYLNIQREVTDALLATISHPYFKLRWLHSRPAFNTEPMRKHLHSVLLDTIIQNNDFAAIQTHEQGIENNCEDDFYDFNDFKSARSITSSVVSRELEMQVFNYFQDQETKLTMLQNYPAVREVFLRHNTAVLSSAPVENLLGVGGLLQSRKKARLSDGLFEKMVLMKGNRYKFE